MYRSDQLVRGHGDYAKRPLPFAALIAPVLPNTGDAEKAAVFHPERAVFSPLVAFIETIHGHDAAAFGIGVAEHAFLCDCFRARIDRLNFGPGLHPVRDEAPSQFIYRDFIGRGIATRHRKFGHRLGVGPPMFFFAACREKHGCPQWLAKVCCKIRREGIRVKFQFDFYFGNIRRQTNAAAH